MMDVLFLTASEKSLFESLDEGVRDGWKVEEEKLQYNDDPKHRKMRLHLARLKDPKILEFRENAAKAESAAALAELLADTDLKDVHDGDLAELFFALGPVPIGKFIEMSLKEAQTDEDIEDVAAFSTIRNSLLISMQPSS